ncbi:LOW QUALITY PROTEIN: hypothetical protein HID58_040438, partial [Brassica napus]
GICIGRALGRPFFFIGSKIIENEIKMGGTGRKGSSRRRRGITLLGDENEEGTVLREIEIENRKKRARWRRTEALNRRSIFSKRKRRPDLLTPHASSLFHWSLCRRVFANRKVAASNRKLLSSPNPRRIVPILARYGLQLLEEMDRF